jgi:protein O-GlcNAc transferase
MTSSSTMLPQAIAALERGDAESARRTCDTLLGINPRDAAARHLRGRCMAATGSLAGAIEDFRHALHLQPDYLMALADLGIALAAAGRRQEAVVQLTAALALNGQPAQLHFALGQCRHACGDLPGARQSYLAAISRVPRFAAAHNDLGVVYDRLGDHTAAIRCFEQARCIEPRLATAHRNLAAALRRSGRAPEAAAALRDAAALAPDDGDLLCELSETLCDAGRWQEALDAARAALVRAPRSARAHAAAGAALLGADQCAPAAEALAQALSIDASLGYVAVNWGEALLRLQRPQEAAVAYRRALGTVNGLAEAHLGLGRALLLLDDTAGASHCFRDAYLARPDALIACAAGARLEELGAPEAAAAMLSDALMRSPADVRLHHALGGLLHRRGRLEQALASYDQALKLAPDELQILLDRGHALESLGRFASAIASFERARELQPACAAALAGLVSCAFRRCDWSGLQSAWAALEALPDGRDALHPFLLLAAGLSPGDLRRLIERRARRLPVTAARSPVPRTSSAPLRVAYLSPDFREHAVAHALVSVIESHDRRRVQPVGVWLAAADRSEIGARLTAAFEVVVDAAALSDREVVARLRELQVDIAVDLAGFTTGARTGIFAARCAPIQVSYLGFPSTMGATFIDYLIADEVVIPRGEDASYAERVLRLPHCYLPLDSTRLRTSASVDREAVGLPPEAFVFCAFNNSYKITRPMFAVWMSLLREIPGSVLWLRSMSDDATDNLRHAAAELGVHGSRLIFAAHVPRMDEYLARLALADLFLDTLPYNAHTTAADALWAGVPVISCRGATFAGRVGASLLTAAGLPDLVCHSMDDYQRLALSLATRPEELRRVRARLAGCHASAAFDMRLYTRNLEAVFHMMEGHADE